jgi:hypothetical protein
MGFRVVSRDETACKSAILAKDDIALKSTSEQKRMEARRSLFASTYSMTH